MPQIIGFICYRCQRYCTGTVCECGEGAGQLRMPTHDLNARVDRRWSKENDGKGHYVRSLGRHFATRRELRQHCQREGLTAFEGPAGTNVGVPHTVYTDAERRVKIHKERKRVFDAAFAKAEKTRRSVRI